MGSGALIISWLRLVSLVFFLRQIGLQYLVVAVRTFVHVEFSIAIRLIANVSQRNSSYSAFYLRSGH
jgi:hypothetical protein